MSLRSNLIRLAATLPKGNHARRAVITTIVAAEAQRFSWTQKGFTYAIKPLGNGTAGTKWKDQWFVTVSPGRGRGDGYLDHKGNEDTRAKRPFLSPDKAVAAAAMHAQNNNLGNLPNLNRWEQRTVQWLP